MNDAPAFPSPPFESSDGMKFTVGERGMTLRDYFAAKALAFTLAENPDYPEVAARRAYIIADIMLEVGAE